MLSPWYRNWLKRQLGGTGRKRGTTRGRKGPGRRPAVERLEDRWVPAAAWNAMGPAPIVAGQTFGNLAVSGRITGVAADPVDPSTIFIAAAGGGVWKTSNGGNSWTPLTDNLTDSGGKPIVEFMGAIAETRGPSNNQIVYAGMGEANNSGDSFYGQGILVSTDGGATWALQNNAGAFTGRTVSKIAIDPFDPSGKTVYAAIAGYGSNGTGGNTGIWKSSDGGLTWTNTTAANGLSSNAEWSDVVIDPKVQGTLYAAEGDFFGSAGNGVYKSTNGGTTWSLLANGPKGSNAGRIALAVFNNGTTKELFVSVAGVGGSSGTNFGELRQMVKSTDDGATFTDLTANVPNYMGAAGFGQGWYDTTLAISPANANYIYAGGSDNGTNPQAGNVESFDGGTTWQRIVSDPAGNGPHGDDHAVAFDAGGNLIDGNDGGVFRLNSPTSSANQRWQSLNSNLQITQFTGVAADPTTAAVAYGGSQDNGTEKTTGSVGWTQLVGGDGGITRVDPRPSKNNIVYQEFTNISLDVSFNFGATFNSITGGPNPIHGNKANFYAPYVLDSAGNVLFGSNVLDRSTDQGTNWTAIGQSGTAGFTTNNANIDAIAVAPSNGAVIYVAAGGHLFVTTNTGGAWNQRDLPGGVTAGSARNSIAVDPSDLTGGTAYAVVDRFTGGGKHVYKTTNFGTTWTDISAGLLDTPADSVAVDATTVYVGTDVGAYATTDGGTTWSVFGSGLPHVQVIELAVVPGLQIIDAGTHGRGLYQISTAAQPPAFTSATGATFSVGTASTFTVVTVGNPSPVLTESGSLPVGVTFTDLGNGTATLGGTPAAGQGGAYVLTFSASSTAGTATQTFTLIVTQPGPAFTSARSTTFLVNSRGLFTITTTGSPAPALTESGALPVNVAFQDNRNGTAYLTGIPARDTSGTYTLTLTASNSVGVNTQTFTLVVDWVPVITSPGSATFAVGTAQTFTVTTNGTPVPVLTESGALPTGVTFADNGNGTAALAGTPAGGTTGAYTVTLTASNRAGVTAQTVTLTVIPAPAAIFTSAASATFTVGTASTFTVTTTGSPAPALTESPPLPTGVGFTDNGNGTAKLSGTPAANQGGTYTLTFTASNANGTAKQTFTLTVDQAPAVTSASSATFTVGTASTFTVTTTGVPTAALTESGALPTGVSFTDNGNGTAKLTGTPAAGQGGTYTLTITASNGIGSPATQTFTLTVNQAPAVTSATSATFTVGTASTFTVTATGFPTPALTESGTLPTGVSFTDNGNGTGKLAGTPAANQGGTYVLTFTASNAAGTSAQTFTLTVDQAPAITSASSATFAVGSAQTFTVTTSGVPAPALTESGAPPTGVSFTDNGNGTAKIAGTPAAGSTGTYTLTITASNGIGSPATQTFTLTVNPAPAVTFTSATSATFTVGTASTFTVTTTGSPTPTLTESGPAVAGVSFADNGDGTAKLFGTPAANQGGTYTLTFTASNASGTSAQTFTLTVDQAPAVTSASSATFTVGTASTFTVTTSGVPAPALTESGALPTGVSFTDNGNGTAKLAGTPAANQGGTYTLTFTASNGIGSPATQTFTLTVDQAPAVTSASSATFTVGTPQTFTVTTTGVPTATLTESGALPTGVGFTDNGNGTASLSGTPAAGSAGSYTFTVSASNAAGTGTQTFTLTVNPTAPAVTVTNVSSNSPNRIYTPGQTISIQVTFSGPVFVTGSPQLALNAGHPAVYSSGSGTNVLTFLYTVSPGDGSNTWTGRRLDYATINALTGGTITDSSAHPAVRTLAAPGAAGSLGANTLIYVYSGAPKPKAGASWSPVSDSYRASKNVLNSFASVLINDFPDNNLDSPTVFLFAPPSASANLTIQSFQLNSDGTFSVQVTGSGSGIVTFQYYIIDSAGHRSQNATVTINVS
jgi:hypothetical protein